MLVTASMSADMRYPTYPVVWAKQGDRLARKLAVGLYDGGVSWTPPGSGVAYAVRFRKPDGTMGYYDTDERGNAAVSVSGSVATVTLAQQALACPGRVEMDLDVYTTTGTVAEHLSTFSWAVMVEAAPCGMDSSDYINVTDGAARRQAIAQDYSATATYAVGAYCIQNHLLYRCTVAISTPEAWNAAHWTSVRVMEEVVRLDGILDAKIDSTAATLQGYIAPAFASGSHRKGEMCFRLGVLYCCNTSYVGSGSMAWREQFWNVVSVSDVVRGLRSDVDGLERSKADVYALLLTNKKLNYLAELTKGQVWDVEAGTTPAYQQSVPSGAKAVAVNGVGGKTVVFNQLSNWNASSYATATGGTVNFENGVATYEATDVSYRNLFQIYFFNSAVLNNSHKFYIGASVYNIQNENFEITISGSSADGKCGGFIVKSEWQRIGLIFTQTIEYRLSSSLYIGYTSANKMSVGDVFKFKDFIFIDLTEMFGAGSEPSTVEQFKAMFPEDYYAYNTGSLLSANVTSVDSKDANSLSLGSLSIPAALRTAYPLKSAGSVYDEYDIERKKFIQRVGSYTFTGGETVGTIDVLGTNEVVRAWVTANVPDMSGDTGSWKYVISNKLETSGNYNEIKPYTIAHAYSGGEATYPKSFTIKLPYSVGTTAAEINAWLTANTPTVFFALNTPVETDISQYFDDDNLLTVDAGGTLTFTQDNTVTSNIPVPNDTEYAVQLSDAV